MMNKKQTEVIYKNLLSIASDITADNASSMFIACVNLGKLIGWLDLQLQDMEEEEK